MLKNLIFGTVKDQSERNGLPGWHGPGVQAADVDGDGLAEVLFLTQDSLLNIISGRTGEVEVTDRPPIPDEAELWEQLVVANLRGQGDRDILL